MSKQVDSKKWKKYTFKDKNKEERLVDFLEATKDGQVNVLRILKTTGEVDVNEIPPKEKEGQGMSALHLAVRHNHLDCVKFLLEQEGIEVNPADRFGFRPIHDAAMLGHTDCMKELLAKGAAINGVDSNGLDYITPLYYAIKHNDIESVRALQNSGGFNKEICDRLIWELGATNRSKNLISHSTKEFKAFTEEEMQKWLKSSAITGNVDYVKEKSINECPDFVNKNGFLVLAATQHGHRDYLQTLMDMKFNSNEANKNGSSALHYAARYGHVDCIQLLLKHGAELNAKNLDNWAPIHTAIRQNNIDSVKELINQGCDVNMPGGELNDTPVHVASKIPVDVDLMKELLLAKPSMTIKNTRGELAMDVVDKEDPLHEILLEYVRN